MKDPNWAGAGISEQVKEKPVGVEILGEKVVLYPRQRWRHPVPARRLSPTAAPPLHKVRLP